MTGSPERLKAADDEGQELALTLRQQRPAHNTTNRAILKVRDADFRRRTVPLTVVATVGADQWMMDYLAVTNGVTNQLTIQHRENQSPVYIARVGGGTVESVPAKTLSRVETLQPFAGTDFWVCDLGLEFLFWPEQRILRSEPHSGVMCRVLESRNPQADGYARVVSWIEPKHLALLGAEGNDSKGRVLKTFSVSSVSREGVREMKMRDQRTDSVTELAYVTPKE